MKQSDPRVQSFLDLCTSDSDSVETLRASFHSALERLGFLYYACCSHVDPLARPIGAVMLQNYPPAWVQHFSEEKLYRIDPVLKLAESRTRPFSWDDAFSSHLITKGQKTVLDEGATAGIKGGYTVPITWKWMAGGPGASCSVVPDSGTMEPFSYRTLAVEAMAKSLYVAVRSAQAPRIATSTPSGELTRRQRQFLILIARGMDVRTVCRLPGIDPYEAHSEIEQIKQRLGVGTLEDAVFRALATGQISFGAVFVR